MTVVWRIWHDDDEARSCDKHFWLFPRRIVVLFIRLFRKLSDERFVGAPLWAFNCEVLCVMEMWRQPEMKFPCCWLSPEFQRIKYTLNARQMRCWIWWKKLCKLEQETNSRLYGLFGCVTFRFSILKWKPESEKHFFINCNIVLVYRLMHWRHPALPRSASIMCVYVHCRCLPHAIFIKLSRLDENVKVFTLAANKVLHCRLRAAAYKKPI